MKIKVTPGKQKRLLDKLGQITTRDMIKGDKLSEDEIKELAELFDPWKIGEDVVEGDLREYEGELYECIDDHTTQSDWTPDITDSLWKSKSAPGVIPEWEQPEGSHDAYDEGDKVRHDGKTWESDVDGNAWEPPEQWTEVT